MALKFRDYTSTQIIGLVVVASLLLMENIDAHILNVAIPQMVSVFSTNVFALKLAVTSYLIGLSVFIPISGWISDRYGTRNILIFSNSLFTLMSIACGLTSSLKWLIIFRLLQGIAGAFMVPVARLLMLKIFSKEEMVKAYTIMGMPVVLGPVLAPVIGGYLVTYFNWRFIFWVNIPLGIMAFYATVKYINNYREKQQKFNLFGYIFLAIFIACGSFWLDLFLMPEVESVFKWKLLAVALLSGVIYFFIERSSRYPVIRYRLFRLRTFNISFFSTIIVRAALGGRAFILAIFLELTFHLNALDAGAILIFMSFGVLASRNIVRKALEAYGFRRTLTYANLGSVIALALLGMIEHIGWFLYLVLFLNGVFASAQFMSLNILYYTEVESVDYGAAVSLAATWQQLGTSLGVIVAAGMLHLFNQMMNTAFSIEAFHFTFWGLAIINILSQLLINKLSYTDGQSLLAKK